MADDNQNQQGTKPESHFQNADSGRLLEHCPHCGRMTGERLYGTCGQVLCRCTICDKEYTFRTV